MNAVWRQALREGAIAGTVAGALSTVALAVCGQRVNGSAVAPINAVSHWVWGDEALVEDRPTLRNTGIGLATQHVAAIFWAVLYSRVFGHRAEAKEPANAIAGAIATSATAYLVDYTITPKRLTPGYEHRLDGKGMFAVYAALAAGLAIGALAAFRIAPTRRRGAVA
jgi:hypothetical protein